MKNQAPADGARSAPAGGGLNIGLSKFSSAGLGFKAGRGKWPRNSKRFLRFEFSVLWSGRNQCLIPEGKI